MEAEEVSWCPSWSNSLWQGFSCRLVHCPAGNATDPIWRVLVSSDGISSWTTLKPQHSNSNPNPSPLANQLWCIDFLTPPTPLIILWYYSFTTPSWPLVSWLPHVSTGLSLFLSTPTLLSDPRKEKMVEVQSMKVGIRVGEMKKLPSKF